MKKRWIVLLVCITAGVQAQSILVEYDKTRDYSQYKTFRFGDSQITTPEDQKKISDQSLHQWIIDAITQQLSEKGLKRSDSAADLTITYAAGTLQRSDVERLGPVSLTPGRDANSNIMYEYRQTSVIIDMNDRSNVLIWRINSTTNMTREEGQSLVDAIVKKGLKKFGRGPRRKKK